MHDEDAGLGEHIGADNRVAGKGAKILGDDEQRIERGAATADGRVRIVGRKNDRLCGRGERGRGGGVRSQALVGWREKSVGQGVLLRAVVVWEVDLGPGRQMASRGCRRVAAAAKQHCTYTPCNR